MLDVSLRGPDPQGLAQRVSARQGPGNTASPSWAPPIPVFRALYAERRCSAAAAGAAPRPSGQHGPFCRRRRRLGVPSAGLGQPHHPTFAAEVEEMLQLVALQERDVDPERPTFHVLPKSGWMNDPNGPLYVNGRYHLFFQHVVTGADWDWGIVWGHVASSDLVHWEHLPSALRPSPGGPDADGCFSGCALLDPATGAPTVLYTAVRLRSNPECGPLPPTECDLQLPFIESQCIARADVDDPQLLAWSKESTPIIPLPPPGLPLTGWRDPFIVDPSCMSDGPAGKPRERGKQQHLMLIGSGLRDTGGCVLKYRSSDLTKGWEFSGTLCTGGLDTGQVWECPLLVRLAPCASPAPNPTHFLCVSPDAPTNPTLYWLGRCTASPGNGVSTSGNTSASSVGDAPDKFDLERATGPMRLDLGDTLYAPNTLYEGERNGGRTLLWGWLQERRAGGGYDYAGCMSVPRVLSLRDGRLHQEPAPELVELRRSNSFSLSETAVAPGSSVPLGDVGVGGSALDIELRMTRGDAQQSGLRLRSWNAGGEGGAVLLYNWETRRLEVKFEAFDPEKMAFSLDAPKVRTIGGPCAAPADGVLDLRVLIDGSCLEVFTGTGEALSTRVYRGAPAPGTRMQGTGVEVITIGGEGRVESALVYGMRSIWERNRTRLSDMTMNA